MSFSDRKTSLDELFPNSGACHDRHLNTSFKFCPECGVSLKGKMSNENFQKLLEQTVILPNIIYQKPSGDEFCEFKMSELLDSNAECLFNHCLSFRPFAKQTCLILNYHSRAIDDKYTKDLFEFLKNPKKLALAKDKLLNLAAMDIALLGKDLMLKLLDIKHVQMTLQETCIETLEDVLVILIENEISNPICGIRFVLNTDQDFKYPPDKHPEYWCFPENYKTDENTKIKYTLLDEKNIPWEECNKSSKKIHDDIIKEYTEMQADLDALLDQIQVDIYYSSRKEKIYLREELLRIFSTEILYMNFKLEDHCKLIRIKHINVYVFKVEMEDLFEFNDTREKLERIGKAFEMSPEERGWLVGATD
jgi:hypothetical protein